jgi:predicted AAA+ superfamily ATPase
MSARRKPLVLRGARQAGKTTVVEQFAENYSQFIHLNLERAADKELFVRYKNPDERIAFLGTRQKAV